MSTTTAGRSFLTTACRPARFGTRLASAGHAIAEGSRAAAEYQRLEAMTDAQLRAIGLIREELPRTIFERHFG